MSFPIVIVPGQTVLHPCPPSFVPSLPQLIFIIIHPLSSSPQPNPSFSSDLFLEIVSFLPQVGEPCIPSPHSSHRSIRKFSRHHPSSTLKKEGEKMPNIEYQITYFIGTTYLSPSHCRWLRVVARLLDHADFGVESTSIRELQTLWSNVQTRDLLLEIMTVEYRAGWLVLFLPPPIHKTPFFFPFPYFFALFIKSDSTRLGKSTT